MDLTRRFSELSVNDVDLVGGKNASLGEMIRELSPLGVSVPDGFAVTAEAYRYFVEANRLAPRIRTQLDGVGHASVEELADRSRQIRSLMLDAELPDPLKDAIKEAYRALGRAQNEPPPFVAVRSSATAEDLPTASFAGQQDSFLYVHGDADLLDSVKRCFASLFTARAIHYREDMGFDHFDVALSVGVQRMVRSDTGSAGVMFTLDTESGFRDVVMVTSAHGLGESVVQGKVSPDQFFVHKPTLEAGFSSIITKRMGAKETALVFDAEKHRLRTVLQPPAARESYSLNDAEIIKLASWGVKIEKHYSRKRKTPSPMDIEWAKDGETGELFIVQARPETVHAQQKEPAIRVYHLEEEGQSLAKGLAVGDAIAVGKVRIIQSPKQIGEFRPGEVLVTDSTDPDWEPIMKQAAAIVTERGGRTSHAAIIARELGIPAVVGAVNACDKLCGANEVTVSCAKGQTGVVYHGRINFEVQNIDPKTVPKPKTATMMNLANPELAFKYAQLPSDGVGLLRMEFVFASWVRIHPLAVTRFESLDPQLKGEITAITRGYKTPRDYFVDRLAQGIGTIAASFWPRPVVLRFSDFKTNEYAHLIGGSAFEPKEENPMIGWRGASRYYHPEFKEGFELEVSAVKRVRRDFGLKNLKLMIPFCRTPAEGKRVLDVLKEAGLTGKEDDLDVYVMAEIPSNIILADQFAEIFDGFSIGSNDLTQLTLGIDRDSARVAPLFDERNDAIKRSCASLIKTAHAHGKKVGICGQAPSDFPDFAEFLVREGIDSISLTPDALVRTRIAVAELEKKVKQ